MAIKTDCSVFTAPDVTPVGLQGTFVGCLFLKHDVLGTGNVYCYYSSLFLDLHDVVA